MRRLALPALLCAAALAAGCAAPGRPPLAAAPEVGPNFDVPDARSRMIYLARQEWRLFGRPVVIENGTEDPALAFDDGEATHEVQAPMLSRVLMYWYAVSRLPIVGYQGELRPWSAAFISWLAKGAGLMPEEFPPTVLHWDYIERFLAAGGGERFVARDPARYAPRAGDLVCNARAGNSADFARLGRGPYHCDIVVEVHSGEIDAIGGNVGDVVALSRLPTDAQGLLAPHPRRPWAAVIEQREGE